MQSLPTNSEVVRTVRGSVTLGLQSSANTVLGMVFFVILARLISVEEMGVYAALTFAYGFLGVVGSFGLQIAGARFVPKLLAENKKDEAAAAAKRIVVLGSFASLAVTAVAYLSAPALSSHLAKSLDYVPLFQMNSLVVLTTVTAAIIDGLLLGVQEFNWLSIIRILGQILKIATSIALILSGFGLYAVVLGLIAYNVCLTLIPLPILRRRLGASNRAYPLRPIVDYALPLLGSTVLIFLSGAADTFIVILFMTTGELGVYNVAVTASTALVSIVLGSIRATLLPAMSGAYGRSGRRSVENAVTESTKYTMLVYSPLAAGLAALAPPAIVLLAGEPYSEAAMPFALISIMTICLALATPMVEALNSLGKTRKVFVISAAAVLSDVVVSVPMVSAFGIAGAAVGRGVLFLVTFIVSLYMSKKEMRIQLNSGPGKAVLASVLMMITLQIFYRYNANIVLLPVYTVLGFVVYLLVIRASEALTQEDLAVLEKSLPRNFAPMIQAIGRLTSQTKRKTRT